MTSRRSRPLDAVAAMLVCILCATRAHGLPSDAAVPFELQADIISKLWCLDRNFGHHDPIVLGVLYQREYRASRLAADGLCEGVLRRALRIRCVLIEADECDLGAELDRQKIDALYVAPLRVVSMNAITAATRIHHVRTVTAVDAYVEAGIAVSITLVADKPQLTVNVPAAKAEGADFSSQLLKLARVRQ